MAIPTISDIQGILGFRAYEGIAFQPGVFSDSTVTAWVATGLRAGLTIDPDTGLIEGNVPVAGYYVVGVVATNGTGDSAPVYFTFGILAASGTVVTPGGSDVGIDLDVDVVTRRVTPANAGSGGATAVDAALAALFHAKAGDVILLNFRFYKAGVVLDPDPTAMKFAVKEFDTEARVVMSEDFEKVGTGETAYFQMPVALTAAAIAAVLGNYDRDKGTSFLALADLEWKQDVSIGTTTELISTTQTFGFNLARGLAD